MRLLTILGVLLAGSWMLLMKMLMGGFLSFVLYLPIYFAQYMISGRDPFGPFAEANGDGAIGKTVATVGVALGVLHFLIKDLPGLLKQEQSVEPPPLDS